MLKYTLSFFAILSGSNLSEFVGYCIANGYRMKGIVLRFRLQGQVLESAMIRLALQADC